MVIVADGTINECLAETANGTPMECPPPSTNETVGFFIPAINSAKAKMANLQASFGGKLLPSVKQMLQEETVTMDALQKDTEFLIGVTRDNAKEINSLLLTAAADATANQTYKENLEGSMEEVSPIPSVGCPVL